MRNPTPAPVIVPAAGAPTCRGVALTVRPLTYWSREEGDRGDHYDHALLQARRAVHDGHLLCLRPTTDRPACVGLTATAFAVASLADDFAARALVVDPYDADGNDLREDVPWVGPGVAYDPELEAREIAAVAVWEGSEATGALVP